MSNKLEVAVIFGGQSVEHEVSVQSTKNIVAAIDSSRANTHLIFVDKSGQWFLVEDRNLLDKATITDIPDFRKSATPISVLPGAGRSAFVSVSSGKKVCDVDVVFPIIHGHGGEDGSLQGLLHLAGVPYVGPDYFGSAIAMDKEIAKRLLMTAGLPVARFVTVRGLDAESVNLEHIVLQLGLPLFVKPARQGSSVGVSKVKQLSELRAALRGAAELGIKVLVEECIYGREIECAVLGNEYPEASQPGEVIVAGDDFYSYDAKYISSTAASTVIPACLTGAEVQTVRNAAVSAFQATDCEGMARVDMFLTAQGSVYINEINTLPGFTAISMYPKMWEASGVSYPKLVHRLLDFAIERFERERSYRTNV